MADALWRTAVAITMVVGFLFFLSVLAMAPPSGKVVLSAAFLFFFKALWGVLVATTSFIIVGGSFKRKP